MSALAVMVGCVLGVLFAGEIATTDGDSWQVWQDYGQWEVSEDRRTVRTERSSDCWDERVRIVEQASPDRWRIQFERRHRGEFCELAGCISRPDDEFSCGTELRLPEPIPAGTVVWASCPASDPDIGQEGRSPQTTLAAGVATVCSESPESS